MLIWGSALIRGNTVIIMKILTVIISRLDFGKELLGLYKNGKCKNGLNFCNASIRDMWPTTVYGKVYGRMRDLSSFVCVRAIFQKNSKNVQNEPIARNELLEKAMTGSQLELPIFIELASWLYLISGPRKLFYGGGEGWGEGCCQQKLATKITHFTIQFCSKNLT